MKLFTPARDRALNCDAYLVDSSRIVRPLRVALLTPAEPLVDDLVGRVMLMGRSLYGVRNQTFALFAGERGNGFAVAPTAPFHEGVLATLRDTLADYGTVDTEPDLPAFGSGLDPLLAYERGRVSFFDSLATHGWLGVAGRRGLRVLSVTLSHAPGDDFVVGDRPVAELLAAPDEIVLDLDALGELPDAELDRLLDEQLEDWDKA